MKKHCGKVLSEIAVNKALSVDDLMVLLNLNRLSVLKLFQTSELSWTTLTTIGRIMNHDFSVEFPDLANKVIPHNTIKRSSINGEGLPGAGVFLIDDSEMDTLVFKLTFKEVMPGTALTTFYNADTAINSLLDIYVNAPDELPKHIFLDLKMPLMSGEEFLSSFQRLNIDPYCKIKIHILTSSIFYSEIQKYLVHPLITTFISKPLKLEVIKSIFP